LFRAVVKDVIREKGIKLTGNFGRELASEVKSLNERYKIEPPLTIAEFLESYVEIAKELVEEHFSAIQAKIKSETKQQ